MARRVAFQIDPIEKLNPAGDSSLRIAAEALKRGFEVYLYQPAQLAWLSGSLTVPARRLHQLNLPQPEYVIDAPAVVDLSQMDVIWVRQDPPFDMAYIASLQLLEFISGKVLVLNDPRAIRDNPEKLLVQRFPALTPPTLISRDRAAIDAFRAATGDVILKPLFGHAGHGVFHFALTDGNFGSGVELLLARNPEPLIVQKYVPEVRQGDRRIILVEGEAVGVFARIPAVNETRAAMRTGSKVEKSTLTPREREICTAIGPTLKAQGLLFVGIDVLGDWLTEINVTSPTGTAQLNAFNNICIEALIWDAAETRLG